MTPAMKPNANYSFMKKTLPFFLFILLSTAFHAVAQSPLGASLRFGRITVEKGLSHGSVVCIFQDSQGFLWFGTEDGLNKYDGYSFDIYKNDPTNERSISNNNVRCLFEDSRNDLWIGTDNGLNKYVRANGSFKRYISKQGDNTSLSNNLITSITEDKNGKLWIGTSNGLHIFDTGTEKFTVVPSRGAGITSPVISVLLAASNGTIWAGTASEGLCSIDPKTLQVNSFRSASDPGSLSENEIIALAEDRQGHIWVGTVNGGANRYDPDSKKFTRFTQENSGLTNNSVFSIREDQSGMIWIGTLGGGLHLFNPRTGSMIVYRHSPQNPESIANNKIWCVFEDHSGTLWFGTSGGASFYNRTISKFNTYKPDNISEGTGNNSVFAVCEGPDGIAWTGVLGGGLHAYDRKRQQFVNGSVRGLDQPALRFANIFAITSEKNGTVWAGTGDGLIRYVPSTGSLTVFRNDPTDPSSISNNYIRSILFDRNGFLWVGTHGGGLNRLDPKTGKCVRYTNETGRENTISSNVVMGLYEDRPGNIWIATYGGGLCKFDPNTSQFKVYRNDADNANSISSNFIHCIYQDRSGRLWIGTYGGGLNLMDPAAGTFIRFTEQNGLPNNVINGIVEDASGNLWISTNNGVCKVTPETKEGLLSLHPRTYNTADGLQNKFNENSCHAGANGWLYFGGNGGLNAFHPDSITDNLVVPPVVITRFYLFEKPARMDTLITNKRTLELNHRQNFFSFEFAALNYLFPEKNRYAYKMEGLNDEWIYSGDRRYATYTNIDPGHYIFRVKACNNDGIWNEEGISIDIIITPPFYKTWWFTALSALIITLLILTYIRIRTNTLVRQNVLLEEKVNLRTHELQEKNQELVQTMDHLRSTQDQLVQSEKMASLGQLTAGIAHEIQNPLNFVNNFSELSVDLLTELDEAKDKTEQEEIISDLKQNLEKINFHGKRADSIVKGMLQHSRPSSAEKQPTVINRLVEEFYNLAFHGMRAKDSGFNCTMEKELDETLPKIRVIPQDISRVILNMFNNSFYSLDEKSKKKIVNYEPKVTIKTSREGTRLVLTIRDNGTGIPADAIDKIFNPFFTTKPTGQGTGLGLSISYDIIAKGHQGDIKVDSKPGEFTEFRIYLPIND